MNLSLVPTVVIERLRDAARRGELEAPISAAALHAAGLSSLVKQEGSFVGLNSAALVAIANAVLDERARSEAARADLVWTGPDSRSSLARDTAVVVQELFTAAKESVVIAGFRFDHGESLLASLHASMRDRGIACRIYAEATEAGELIRRNWHFGLPHPEVFAFVPEPGVFASLHAKCVVADHHRVLITSANFTDRGHSRNIEVGVLLDDRTLAESIERQFSFAQQDDRFAAVKG